MSNRIKETFDKIHAEEELKTKTKDFLARKTQGYSKNRMGRSRRLVSAAACLLFILIGCGFIYFTPTATISIDINPSVELGINRFDRVISVAGYHEDGQGLADSLNIKFLNYNDALSQILERKEITALLSQDEILTISVIGSDERQCGRMLSNIQYSTADQENAYCYSAEPAEVAKAHEMGLSYGKYKAFLELRTLVPDITPEEVQGLSMREIRDLIQSFSDSGENDKSSEIQETESGRQRRGSGKGGRR